jgi:hypothetical protein
MVVAYVEQNLEGRHGVELAERDQGIGRANVEHDNFELRQPGAKMVRRHAGEVAGHNRTRTESNPFVYDETSARADIKNPGMSNVKGRGMNGAPKDTTFHVVNAPIELGRVTDMADTPKVEVTSQPVLPILSLDQG